MKVFKIIGAVVMLTAIILSGCSAFDIPDGQITTAPGKGFVLINIQGSEASGSARTAFPDMNALTYNAAFVCTSDAAKTAAPAVITSGIPFLLEEGTWTINIDAKRGNDVVGKAVITGVNVSTTVTYTVNNVLITPEKTGTGTVELRVRYHGNLNDLSTAEIFFGGQTIDIKTLASAAGFSVFTADDVDAGSYMIRAELRLGSKFAGNAEAVHVYNGMTTELEWEFWETSLVETKTLVIDVPITYSGTIEDLDLELIDVHGTHIYTVHSPGTYRFSILVGESMNSFEGTLTITTGNGNNFEVVIDEFSYGSGTNILPAITIYTLTANVGIGGKLEVNGVEYDGVMDFLANTEITLEAIPGSGATLKVDGADYTTPFNIAGDTVVAVTFTPSVDDLVIWEWSYDADGWTNINNNTFATVKGKSIAVSGAAATGDTTNGGVSFGRLAIGSKMINGGTPASPTSNSAYDPAGEFDFSGTNNIKVTIGYKIVTGAARNLRINLNNNTTSAGASVVIPEQLAQYAIAANETSAGATLVGTINQSATSLHANASAFNLNTVLSRSFIGINMTGSGGTILLTSIKIEYVEPVEPPPADENLIFEWTADSQPLTGGNFGGNFGGKMIVSSGTPELTIQNAGASAITPVTTGPGAGGFRIGGAANSGTRHLSIGQSNSAQSTTATSPLNATGHFNFSTRKAKVIINYADAVQFGTRTILRVSINNTTGTAATSPLGASSQLVNYTLSQLNAAAGVAATATAGTVIVPIDPATFAGNTGVGSLEGAFICIIAQHDGDVAGTGNWITITGIKIEYDD